MADVIDWWRLHQGCDFHEWLTSYSVDDDGEQVLDDLTGYDAELVFLSGGGKGAMPDKLTVGDGLTITPEEGRIDIEITDEQSLDTIPDIEPSSVDMGQPIGGLPFKLILIHADGFRECIAEGTIHLIRGIDVP